MVDSTTPTPPASSTAPAQLPATPWYTSKVQIAQVVTLVSALAAISPKIANTLGLTSLAAIQSTVEAVFGTIAFIAPLIGTWFRAKSSVQPLTFTQAGADAHPATIAANSQSTSK
jgi:hypothetical protein